MLLNINIIKWDVAVVGLAQTGNLADVKAMADAVAADATG
jgi:hypothetical protein